MCRSIVVRHRFADSATFFWSSSSSPVRLFSSLFLLSSLLLCILHPSSPWRHASAAASSNTGRALSLTPSPTRFRPSDPMAACPCTSSLCHPHGPHPIAPVVTSPFSLPCIPSSLSWPSKPLPWSDDQLQLQQLPCTTSEAWWRLRPVPRTPADECPALATALDPACMAPPSLFPSRRLSPTMKKAHVCDVRLQRKVETVWPTHDLLAACEYACMRPKQEPPRPVHTFGVRVTRMQQRKSHCMRTLRPPRKLQFWHASVSTSDPGDSQ
jgi:hypothetical protein